MTTPMADRPTVSIRFSAAEIATRVEEMAVELAEKLPPDTLVVSVLKGSFVFAADLLRALYAAGLAPEVDFLTLSSYRKSRSASGQVSILRDLDLDVQHRHVILIDDVLDSGRTLAFAKDLIAARGAARIETCVLLDKKASRAVSIEPDYCAFECPDVFVVEVNEIVFRGWV